MASGPGGEADWQRLDLWLWCARLARHRADCQRLIEAGALRVNRQPTDKAHARLRVGDVLTVAIGREVRVLEVLALAPRRGPASEARLLYRERAEAAGQDVAAVLSRGCGPAPSAAYPADSGPHDIDPASRAEGHPRSA